MIGRVITSAVTVGSIVSTASWPATAQQWAYGPTMMSNHGWWGMILGPFMMIALLAIVVAVVVLLVRWLGGAAHYQGSHLPPGRTALDILRERFARGEIDKQEFEDRRRVLGE